MILSVRVEAQGFGGQNGFGNNGPGAFNNPPPQSKKKKRRRRIGGVLPSPLTEAQEAALSRSGTKTEMVAEGERAGDVYLIRVKGAERMSPAAIFGQISTAVGRLPNAKTISSDVKRIYNLHQFEDVYVDLVDRPSGAVELTYIVVERPVIAEIKYEGLSALDEIEFEDIVDIQEFDTLDIPHINVLAGKIANVYQEKGYFLAQVDVRTEHAEAPDKRVGPETFQEYLELRRDGEATDAQPIEDEGRYVRVIFDVKEFAKVRIEDVAFVGNTLLSDDELRGALRSRESHILGNLTDWGTFKQEYVEIDAAILEFYYRNKGFLDVKVSQPKVLMSHDRSHVTMTIDLEEGLPYTVTDYTVTGDHLVKDRTAFAKQRENQPEVPVFLASELEGLVSLERGKRFSQETLMASTEAISNAYKNSGFAHVNVAQVPRMNRDTHEVAIDFEVDAGPRFKLERIDIVGNSRTKDEVIRREFRVFEGDWYDHQQIRRSEARVRSLGFFEDIALSSEPGSKPNTLRVKVRVTERPTGTFNFGFGYSTFENAMVQGSVSQNNLFGGGQTLNLQGQVSRIRRQINFSYLDPYWRLLGDEPLTLQTNVFVSSQNFIDYFRNSIGFGVTTGYPIGRVIKKSFGRDKYDYRLKYSPYEFNLDNFQAFLNFQMERVLLDFSGQSFEVTHLGLTRNLPRYTSSLGLSLVWDQRNNRLQPSKGFYFLGGYELASRFLGSGVFGDIETWMKDARWGSFKPRYLIPGAGWSPDRSYRRESRVNEFHRFRFIGRGYLDVGDKIEKLKNWVLKANVEFGLLASDDPSLIFERYYLGGLNTVRGYQPRSISPVERVGGLTPGEPLREFRVGGSKQLIANLELEFPIVAAPMNIRGVFFFDMGNSYARDENLFYIGNGANPYLSTINCATETCFDPRTDLPLGMYMSAGFGFRWLSPMGPLRFEWGFPLVRRPAGTYGFNQGDRSRQFEFNFGTFF